MFFVKKHRFTSLLFPAALICLLVICAGAWALTDFKESLIFPLSASDVAETMSWTNSFDVTVS